MTFAPPANVAAADATRADGSRRAADGWLGDGESVTDYGSLSARGERRARRGT